MCRKERVKWEKQIMRTMTIESRAQSDEVDRLAANIDAEEV